MATGSESWHHRADPGRRLPRLNWFWLFPLFMVYFISGIAETNRAI
jgi:NADH:ubiquinone oxidoreductase subunit H